MNYDRDYLCPMCEKKIKESNKKCTRCGHQVFYLIYADHKQE